ncbi:hypothetical protein POSPLADRAFT_1156597, partial [Postia placenta MAD-698-R-SB12]
APGRAGGSLEGSLKAVLGNAGAWRGRSGWDGSDVARCRSRGASVPECRAAGVLDPSDWYEVPFVNSDGPWSAIRARLPITDEERRSVFAALWVVTRDVDLILGVEGVLKSRAVEEFVSHVDGGRKGGCACYERLGVRLVLTEAMGQEVKTEVPRAAEAGLYTWRDKGRLCALVRAQLVCAQHADAAPGAGESERLCQRGPSCAVHCRPI